MGNPARKAIKHVTTITKTLFLRREGNSSIMEAMRGSQVPQTVEMPNKHNIKKNMKEKNGAATIALTASGKTTNANPGP